MAKRHPFRFGVVNETTAAPRAWLAQVRQIEDWGYSTFLIRDHLLPDEFGDQYGPLVALSMAAAATTTLRIGNIVVCNDFRHPAILAKEAATLDLMSGGRLELGLGAGWLQAEYAATGMPYDRAGTRIDRLEEAITILKGLFGNAPVTFDGVHYQVNELRGFPTPAQRPHPPLLIGAGQQRMLTLAGREADIVSVLQTSVSTGHQVHSPTYRSAASVAQKLAWVREGAGARFEEIELNQFASFLVSDHRRARTAEFIRERSWTDVTIEDVWAMPSVFAGSFDQIATDLEHRREEYGFSYFLISDRQAEALAPLVARMSGR